MKWFLIRYFSYTHTDAVELASLRSAHSTASDSGFPLMCGVELPSLRSGKATPHISGGRVLSHKIPKGSHRLKIALRNAANAVGNLKNSDLGKFFKKIAFRKGRQAAITATARKIAVIIWNMITKKVQYKPKNPYIFLDEKRRAIAQMRKKISKLGIDPNELGMFTRPNYKLAYEKRVSDNQ